MTYTLRDHNSDHQVVAFLHNELVRKPATIQVGDLVHSQVPWPTLPIVPWGNNTSGLSAHEVRENVTPWPVVVDTQCDNEALVGVRLETEGATCPGSAQSEQMITVSLVPGSISIDCLLNDTEERVPIVIGLIDIHLD